MTKAIKYSAPLLLALALQILANSDKPESKTPQIELRPYWQEKIAGLPSQYPGPFWSPDSRYVAFQALAPGSDAARPQAELLVVDVMKRKIVWNSANHPKRQGIPGRKQVMDLKWLKAPDGLIWIESTGDLWRLTLATGALEHLGKLKGLFETTYFAFPFRKQSTFISRTAPHVYYFRPQEANTLTLRRFDYSSSRDEELWSSKQSKYLYQDADSLLVISCVSELPKNKLLFILQEKESDFPRSLVHVVNLEKPTHIDITPIPAPGVFILHEASLLDDSGEILLTGLARKGENETGPDYIAVYTYNVFTRQLRERLKVEDAVLENWRILLPEKLYTVFWMREEQKADMPRLHAFLALHSPDLTKTLTKLDIPSSDYSISPCGNYLAHASINKNYGLMIQQIVRHKR